MEEIKMEEIKMEEETEIKNLIDIAICSNTDYDIAKSIYVIFLYKYKNNNDMDEKQKWIKLRYDLSEEIFKKFTDRAIYYSNLMITTNDNGLKQVYYSKSDKAIKIALKLKQTGFKNRMIRECKYLDV